MKFEVTMRNIRIVAIAMILTGLAAAQDMSQNSATGQSRDLLTAAQANHSLSMFVAAVQTSGMAKILRDEHPLTVFAPSDRAFASLPKHDLEYLLTNHAAMRILLMHYVSRESISKEDTASLSSARTLVGVKLRTDIRSEGSYVNGAKLSHPDTRCANGMLHVLDTFDPGLVRDAEASVQASRREK